MRIKTAPSIRGILGHTSSFQDPHTTVFCRFVTLLRPILLVHAFFPPSSTRRECGSGKSVATKNEKHRNKPFVSKYYSVNIESLIALGNLCSSTAWGTIWDLRRRVSWEQFTSIRCIKYVITKPSNSMKRVTGLQKKQWEQRSRETVGTEE